MSVQPSYYSNGILAIQNFATANTNRDGTGTIATLVDNSAGPNQVRIERIVVKAAGTTTAGMVRIFVRATSGGTWRLEHELAVAAITPSATVATAGGPGSVMEWAPTNGMILPYGAQLGISTHNAETFNAVAHGGQL